MAERKRRFQAATGITPLEYIHNLGLEESKEMLEGGTPLIEAMTLHVGYSDNSFSRLFKRKVDRRMSSGEDPWHLGVLSSWKPDGVMYQFLIRR